MVSVKLSLVKVMTASGGGFQFGSDCSFMYSTMPVEVKNTLKWETNLTLLIKGQVSRENS